MRITIAIPTDRGINPQTTQCLLEMVARGGYDFHIVVAEHGYTIAENRNYVAVQAVRNQSDYVLMIDDDMTFPPELLDVFLADNKDVVGAAYHPRCAEGEIVKYINAGESGEGGVIPIKIEQLDDPKYKQTFEVHANGTGIMLIKCDVFKKITRPWFMFEYHETGQCKLGEDWYFCEKARAQGIKIFTNPTIKVGHLGEVIY